MTWESRYFVRDFDSSKMVADSDIDNLCNIVNHIPSQVVNTGHYWILLNNKKPTHRDITEWLVKNIYYDPMHDGDDVEHFGQLLDAHYVLSSVLRRDPKEATNREEEYKFQRGNVLFHAGAIVARAVELELDTCIVACTEGTTYREFDTLMSEYTKLILNKFTFPNAEVKWGYEYFPSMAIGIGHGIKHDKPIWIEKYGYKWMSYKDNHKAPNMIRN